MKDYPELTKELSALLVKVHQAIPDTMKAFSGLSAAATANGALDKKTKELIALGIAIAVRCDGCIGFHVQKLVALQVQQAEFMETLGMAIYMGGGPSVMYAAEAMRAYEQFTQ